MAFSEKGLGSVASDSLPPLDCSPPGCSLHGIFQGRIPEWVATSSSRGSARFRNQTCVSHVSCIGGQILYRCATGEASLWGFIPLPITDITKAWVSQMKSSTRKQSSYGQLFQHDWTGKRLHSLLRLHFCTSQYSGIWYIHAMGFHRKVKTDYPSLPGSTGIHTNT